MTHDSKNTRHLTEREARSRLARLIREKELILRLFPDLRPDTRANETNAASRTRLRARPAG